MEDKRVIYINGVETIVPEKDADVIRENESAAGKIVFDPIAQVIDWTVKE